jgi:hypothetical protein
MSNRNDLSIPRTRRTLLAGACLASILSSGVLAAGAAAAPAKAAHAAKLPDWDGVWGPDEGPLFDPSAALRPESKGLDLYQMRDYPPYNAEYERKYRAILDANTAGKPNNDPAARCLPLGMPRMMALYPVEFVIRPSKTYILFEQYSQVRRIFTDGRKHPDDLEPGFTGHSIGRWEGDTLVVDTVGIRGDLTFDTIGTPHSDALHITERLRRTSRDILEDRITIDDPKAFTKPWTVIRHYRRQPTWQIEEFICENNRNAPDANGVTTFR